MLVFIALLFNIFATGILFELTSRRSRTFSRDLEYIFILFLVVCYAFLVFNLGGRLGDDFLEYEYKYANINSIDLDEGSPGFILLMRLVSSLVADSAPGIALIIIMGQLIYLFSLRQLGDLKLPIFASLCFLFLFNRLIFEVSLNTIRSNLAFAISIGCVAVIFKKNQDTQLHRLAIGILAGALLSYYFHPLSSIVFLGLMVIAGVLWSINQKVIMLLALVFTTYFFLIIGNKFGFSEEFHWIGLALLENKIVGTMRENVNITFSLWAQVTTFITLPVIAAEMNSINSRQNLLRSSARAGMLLTFISLLLSSELAIRVCYLTIPIAITYLLSTASGQYRRVVLVLIAMASMFGSINLISEL